MADKVSRDDLTSPSLGVHVTYLVVLNFGGLIHHMSRGYGQKKILSHF